MARRGGIQHGGRALIAGIGVAVLGVSAAEGSLGPQNVLLLYNSQNAESLAVRNAYIAARPGVVQFDLNDATITPGEIGRAVYLAKIRNPVKAFINGDGGGTDRSQQIMAIATTRGLPAVLTGNNEFSNVSPWASLESELTLLQQDLETGSNPGQLPFRFNGIVDNPYHRMTGSTITGFSRAAVKTQRAFVNVESNPPGFQTWSVSQLTPGGIYLVCRLDSAPGPGAQTAVQNIQSLIERSLDLRVTPCATQILLDEDAGAILDAQGLAPRYPAIDDYLQTAIFMTPLGFRVVHDQTNNFITGAELADQSRPLVALASYGENHDLNGGENPPGPGSYLTTYGLHPAAMLISLESYNGNSLIDGTQREDHAQSLDFIALGGSFAICHVKEPFAFAVADMQMLTLQLLSNGLTFAEAAYISIPGLSWQNTPIGDPLARVTIVPPALGDINCDAAVDVEDLYTFTANPVDVNGDFAINEADRIVVRHAVRAGEAVDVGRR